MCQQVLILISINIYGKRVKEYLGRCWVQWKNVSIYEISIHNQTTNTVTTYNMYIHTYALMETPHPRTFIGTSYPLQRGHVIIMLANREGEDTNLDWREKIHLKKTFSRIKSPKTNFSRKAAKKKTTAEI